MPVHPHSALSRTLCSECFPPCCSCKCGPRCNDAAHRKTPFSCGLRQPLELIPGKPSLAFLSYAFLQTYGQSADWRGEEWSHNWGRVIKWLGSHLKYRQIVSLVLFLRTVMLFALQFTPQGRHISYSLASFPCTAAVLCSALGFYFLQYSIVFTEYGCNGGVSARGRCVTFSSN